MKTRKESKGAALVMAVMIALAVWIGGYRSFSRMYAQVEMVFVAGSEGDGLGIANDLNERTKLAYNLVTVARKYLDVNDAAIIEVLSARDALMQAKSIADKYTANVRLSDAATTLYHALGNMQMDEIDARYRVSIFNDLASRNDTISHDPYNQRALAYNRALTAFPANLLRVITFARSAPLFE
jgi:hypothetical protein